MFLEDYPQAKNETEARQKHEELKSNPELFNCAKDQTAFLNIFFGRMWHDLHSNKAFNDFLREKITRKLLKVKVSNSFILKFHHSCAHLFLYLFIIAKVTKDKVSPYASS